jgi:hypothetical protein
VKSSCLSALIRCAQHVSALQIEIPIALELLRRPEYAHLVDEFFFELHFRCEILMYCGWGSGMPEVVDGLQMNRIGAMKFFRQLREMGIRAHIWP